MHHLTEREQNALLKKPVANNESKNDKKNRNDYFLLEIKMKTVKLFWISVCAADHKRIKQLISK